MTTAGGREYAAKNDGSCVGGTRIVFKALIINAPETALSHPSLKLKSQ